mgnify:CR=1 FL=1
MKKIISYLLVTILAISLLTACSSNADKKTDSSSSTEPITYKDGVYTAEQDDFDANSGWKSTIEIVVENGKIVSVDWNAVHKDGGDDKKTQSKNGTYGMVEKGGAQAEWHEQAEKVEAYLIETQDPAAIKYDDGGYTDAIAGVTIHVNDFVELATKALENARE